jgi:hypothetical protein
MANALRGEAPLGDYTLAYDFGVFIELESKTGVKTPRLLATVKEEGFGFADVKDFVWAGLRRYHPMTEEEVIEVLNEFGYEEASKAVSLGVSNYSAKLKEKGKNPPKAK